MMLLVLEPSSKLGCLKIKTTKIPVPVTIKMMTRIRLTSFAPLPMDNTYFTTHLKIALSLYLAKIRQNLQNRKSRNDLVELHFEDVFAKQ
jgi:hypothetical protein